MQKSTIPFLLISFLALVLSSCATNVVKDYTPTAVDKATYDVPYFASPEIDYVYKANISVYGKELTGIFIAKKINERTHRIVFTTEFGNKLLDFEISETDFKVNSIVEELDKKILINTLTTDFRLLFKNKYLIKEQFEDTANRIYKSEDGNGYNYLFASKSDGKLFKMIHASTRKEKINISFTTKNDIFAERIIIEHKNIKLKIELNYFKNKTN